MGNGQGGGGRTKGETRLVGTAAQHRTRLGRRVSETSCRSVERGSLLPCTTQSCVLTARLRQDWGRAILFEIGRLIKVTGCWGVALGSVGPPAEQARTVQTGPHGDFRGSRMPSEQYPREWRYAIGSSTLNTVDLKIKLTQEVYPHGVSFSSGETMRPRQAEIPKKRVRLLMRLGSSKCTADSSD